VRAIDDHTRIRLGRVPELSEPSHFRVVVRSDSEAVQGCRPEPGKRCRRLTIDHHLLQARHQPILALPGKRTNALHVPDEPVDTLLVPLQASWLELAEALEFTEAIGPRRAYGIHDAQINHRGREGPNHWLSRTTKGYRWLAPGESREAI
jgi:hypothetical protein